jgi:hypothetical protein
MSLVPGMLTADPIGDPSAATSCAYTPRWPPAFEYQAITVRPVESEAMPLSEP